MAGGNRMIVNMTSTGVDKEGKEHLTRYGKKASWSTTTTVPTTGEKKGMKLEMYMYDPSIGQHVLFKQKKTPKASS
jgi:ribosomal protein L33